MAVSTVDTTTPTVESTSPGISTGRIPWMSVSSPPANRSNARATTPKAQTTWGSLNQIPPRPSLPASTPVARNRSSAGTPKRERKPRQRDCDDDEQTGHEHDGLDGRGVLHRDRIARTFENAKPLRHEAGGRACAKPARAPTLRTEAG